MVTRRINVLFASKRMRLAMALAQWSYSCDIEEGNLDAPMPIERLRGTVDAFGSKGESKAYEELVSLIEDNPEYKNRMHNENTK